MARADKEEGRGKREETGMTRPRGEELEAWPTSGYPNLFRGFDPFLSSPFELMRRFSEDMDRMFRGFGGGRAGGVFSPPIEVEERDGKLVVCAELPGVKQEDVKVQLLPEGLCIEGERRDEREERKEGYYSSERSYGRFRRLVPLPEELTRAEDAQASFDNGILKVSIPMPESSRQRRREIPIGKSAGELGTGGMRTTQGQAGAQATASQAGASKQPGVQQSASQEKKER